ncbi:MAG: hypothetical protein AB2L14_19880 [Candidatus Xenobiia bacterium LiM19]
MKRTFIYVFLCAFIAVILAASQTVDARETGDSLFLAQSAAPAAATSITGPVKGTPEGKIFVVAAKGGPVTVDAKKAKVRDKSGKFVAFSTIKAGLMVTVKGVINDKTMQATEITVFPKKSK